MKNVKPCHPIIALVCILSQAFPGTHASCQTVTVRGTVSTPTAVVRNATVTIEDAANPANAHSAVTDSLGKNQADIVLTSVAPATTLPTKFELEQNYPNPFTASTAIPYKLKTHEDVRLIIYDILGRAVREASVGVQAAGTHSVLWDGTNAIGHKVVPGVYFYCLQAGGQSRTMKMVLRAGAEGASPLQPSPSASMPDESGTITKRGYVMSQFSRFIRPGYHKITCNATPQRNVWVSSYKDDSLSKVVIVALTMSASPAQQAFTVTDGTMTSFTPYTTSVSKNCVKGADIPALNGTVAVALEPSSITTFVSN